MTHTSSNPSECVQTGDDGANWDAFICGLKPEPEIDTTIFISAERQRDMVFLATVPFSDKESVAGAIREAIRATVRTIKLYRPDQPIPSAAPTPTIAGEGLRGADTDLFAKLERYDFTDQHGHPLRNCMDWHNLRARYEVMATALAWIAEQCPAEDPGPAWDALEGYRSEGNRDDVVSDVVNETLWPIGERARAAALASPSPAVPSCDDPERLEAAITADYENDLRGMSDDEIASEIVAAQNAIDEHEPWLEALVTRQAQRARAALASEAAR